MLMLEGGGDLSLAVKGWLASAEGEGFRPAPELPNSGMFGRHLR